MQITSVMSLPLVIPMGDGKSKILHLKPGKHNYPEVSNKEPTVAEQLRVYRKHRRIGFDELLPGDAEVLKNLTGTPEEKGKKLLEATSVKIGATRKEVKGERNIRRPQAPAVSTRKSRDKKSDNQSGGPVSS